MDFGTTKYIIYAELVADGYVEKNDVIGAIFGQTEGLLGGDLDLRDLQKSGRIGRIDVEVVNGEDGKSYAKIVLPSSLDRVETAIIAATLETVDRVGPCSARIEVKEIRDIRAEKRQYIVNRAKELLETLMASMTDIQDIAEEIREYIRTREIVEYGEEKLPAGPNIDNSDSIIVVEGRADVLNLLRCGIKNVIAVGGASIPKTIVELSKKKVTTIFIDGDRGGELILKESLQRCDIDYIARAPKGREVEELSKKEVLKYLRLRVPVEQYLQQMNINLQRDDDNNGTSERDLLTYEVFKNGDQESQLRYIKLSVKEMEGTNKVKLISPDFEKVLSLEELSEDLLSGVSFLISDVPITQRVIDRFFNGINSNLTIIGREIYITKKPSNLKILRYEDVV
ncbi:MAG TPA: DNA primase [Methanothermococcus okinawensis]|uniref:DNA primase DnaG n=1 Tax=Methanothermococcus okinawensis TaxID=155863 RepID=A0A832ZZD2_9EURY|nr:DNA primase [Methanothermococcus okinawensis]